MKENAQKIIYRSVATSSVHNDPLTFLESRKLSFFLYFLTSSSSSFQAYPQRNNLMTSKYNNLRSSTDTLLVIEAPQKVTQSRNFVTS